MATIIDDRTIILQVSDILLRVPLQRRGTARYKGHHISRIIAKVAESTGKLDPQIVLEELGGDRDYSWRWALGVMFEEFWFSLHPDTEWQPGELVKDGIAGNCDGISDVSEFALTDPSWVVGGDEAVGLTVIEETKCTEQKVKLAEEFMDTSTGSGFLRMHQGRSYCYLYGADIVRWTVLYYRGDWRGFGPVCRQYTVRFEEREIRQTWEMLKQWKDRSIPE